MKILKLAPNRDFASAVLFAGFALCTLLCFVAAALLSEPFFLALPFALLLIFQVLVDYKRVFYLLMFCIPLNIEIDGLPGDLGLDIPGEPLMMGLLLLYVLLLFSHIQIWKASYWGHFFTLSILLQWVWLLFATLYAENPAVAWKFFLAKTWYLASFYFLALHLLRKQADWKLLLWVVFFPLVFAASKALAHHAYLGLSFADVNKAVVPFFRNHVSYAAILALTLPLFWFLRYSYAPWSRQRLVLHGGIAILFLGMLFSYTRAAYLALFLSIVAYTIMRLRLLVPALLAAIVLVLAGSVLLVRKNYFLKYAPSERTIAHQEFGDLVAATYTFEDASTMERYHRWIGGIQMVMDRPITGFGPNNFYPYYRQYTLNRFQTYLSSNPERSGIHNYFLMLAAEQGLPGMLLFVVFLIGIFLYAQRYYHSWPVGSSERHILAGCFMCIVVISAFLLMNDLIETDKVGPFFFLSIVMIWRIGENKAALPAQGSATEQVSA